MKDKKRSPKREAFPLSHAQLRKTTLKPERHRAALEELADSEGLELDLIGAIKEPVVVTKLVRNSQKGDKAGWKLKITVEGAQLQPSSPPPLEVIQINRSILRRGDSTPLKASIPAEDKIISIRPKLQKVPKPFKIRFGDLQYDPTTIFPPDGRRPYFDLSYPWRCLVRITRPSGWSGSGVLIGPRHVLTASHCVDWTPGWLKVDVMYTNKQSQASAFGTLAYAESKVGPGPIPNSQTDEDYAVIVLNQRLGDQFGWLGCRTYNSSWDDETSNWHSIGYPQDWSGSGEIAAYQTNFFLNELGSDFGSARLIRSQTFDNWPGQSGSPIFGFWPQGPYVVGVVSGETPSYNHISGGSLLTSLVSRARAENP